VQVRFCDEFPGGFGWIAAEPAYVERASQALVADGCVWLADALDGYGVAERVRAAGAPAGPLQLIDRAGHGEGIREGTAVALADTLAHGRRRTRA